MTSSSLWYIPLLPLVGFLLNGTIGRRLPRPAVTGIALLFTAIPALIVFRLWTLLHAVGAPASIEAVSQPWIQVSGFTVNFAFTVDHLSILMLGVVTGVGFLIHLYSAGYMAHEDGYWRFFAYLNLFMFFMLVLVLSSSFLLLFVGWEGVGLASYLLIGFYFKKDSAANAGKKAFIVNRIGDFGFLLAMFLLIAHFGTLDFAAIFATIGAHPEWHGGFLTAIALLLVLGAAGKSAQIPLYVWLPDAMEGPTPVSALIHAATMVTAGIYMVSRCHTLFDRSPYALGVVAILGAATALFAAVIGIVQHDIKRVLAYSTISQLGYMFLACGVAAYSAAIFHLITHAFFKALLFLAAGSVIHSLSGEQDMRRMGGLWRRIPITFWTMTAGVVAISGIPPFAGFFSKDEILFNVFSSTNPLAKLLWMVGLLTAGITSFYMFRLWLKTFFGPEKFDEHTLGQEHADARHGAPQHDEGQIPGSPVGSPAGVEIAQHHGVHESPWIMLTPLVLLALLSLVGGFLGVPDVLGGSNVIEHWLGHTLNPHTAQPLFTEYSAGVERTLALISTLVALAGAGMAYVLYYAKRGTANALAVRFRPAYTLVQNKFYIDELYNLAVVTPLLMFSRLFVNGIFDKLLVNGFGAGASAGVKDLGILANRAQSGNIRSYAGWLALGAAAVIALMIFGSTAWLH